MRPCPQRDLDFCHLGPSGVTTAPSQCCCVSSSLAIQPSPRTSFGGKDGHSAVVDRAYAQIMSSRSASSRLPLPRPAGCGAGCGTAPHDAAHQAMLRRPRSSPAVLSHGVDGLGRSSSSPALCYLVPHTPWRLTAGALRDATIGGQGLFLLGSSAGSQTMSDISNPRPAPLR